MSRVYETAIAIAASISRTFKADTYNAATALGKLTNATKKLKEAEKSAVAFKKLDGEISRAKSRLDVASAAMRKLEEAEKAAGGATKESTKWRKAGTREVTAAARQLDRATKAAKKHSEVLVKLGVDTSRMATEQDRLTRALAATERQEKALERYEHSRERLFGKRKEHEPLLAKGKEQLKGIGETVLHLAEGAAIAGEAMHLLVEKTIQTGAEVGESAEKIGIGARALQELRYGARQSGAEVEDLDKALGKMAINIGKHKLAKGKGAAGGLLSIPGAQVFGSTASAAAGVVDPFKQIGLKAKDLANLKPEEQFKKIADGLLKLKTHAERAAVGSEIFGKGITAILPYLAEGSEGIEKLSRGANKFGGVLSDESVAAAVEAEKASKDMNLALAGLANTLGAALLPTAVKTFGGISSWVGTNRADIKVWAEGAAKWIEGKGIPAFKHLVADVQSAGAKVLWLVQGAAKLTGGFGNLAIIVGALRLAPLAVTLGKIGIEGTKAAIAIFKYVAAKKAAAALGGGIDGMGPGAASTWAKAGGAIGVAATAAMVVGAASVGLAIGTYLDEKFHISDDAEHAAHILTTNADDLNEGDRTAKAGAWSLFKASILGGGAGAVDEAKRLQAEALRKKAATLGGHSGPRVHIAPVLQFNGQVNRDDVAKGMDKAKQKALDEFDKREAHRKRVSFGQ